MYKVVIMGAGKIGAAIACLLLETKDYTVVLADNQFNGDDVQRLKRVFSNIETWQVDVRNKQQLLDGLKQHSAQAIISSLPYFLNTEVAEVAHELNLHYFDLTEDVQVTARIREIARNSSTAFVGQCGLAPGFVDIVAHGLMESFETLDTVKLRVGALPQRVNNALHYALTWSTDGVINQYGNLCQGIEHGEVVPLHPLEGLENIQLDGLYYEAFNTSGGLGSLADTYAGRVRTMNYKTVRYPGHCEKMKVLMNDLRLNEDRETLKRILENAIPKTYQDVVLVYVAVSGMRHGVFMEDSYVNKIYPQTVAGLKWSAIQMTTAAGVCAVVDMILEKPDRYKGLVLQENLDVPTFMDNRFIRYYSSKG